MSRPFSCVWRCGAARGVVGRLSVRGTRRCPTPWAARDVARQARSQHVATRGTAATSAALPCGVARFRFGTVRVGMRRVGARSTRAAPARGVVGRLSVRGTRRCPTPWAARVLRVQGLLLLEILQALQISRSSLEVPQFFGHKNSHTPVNKGGSDDLRFAASENPTAGARRRSRGRGREGGSGVRRHPVFKPKNSKSGAAASFPASAGSKPRHLPPRPFRTSLAPSAMA